MKKIISLASALLLLAGIAGCGQQEEAKTQPPTQSAVEQTPLIAEQGQAEMLSGTIEEILTGGGFTYILLNQGEKKTWIAMPETTVAMGDEITIKADQTFTNFYSKALDRSFEELVFSTGKAGDDDTGANPHAMAMLDKQANSGAAVADDSGNASFNEALEAEQKQGQGPAVDLSAASPGSSKAVVPYTELSIDKAEGDNAYRVGEIFERAAELNGQKVTVRAKVMKVSPNIMGRNWLHLQDGSGNPMQNTHDLVVTTEAVPEQGAVVTVTGTLAANKDFGAGYKYAAIIENAEIGD